MTNNQRPFDFPDLSDLYLAESSRKKTKPIVLITNADDIDKLATISAKQKTWLEKTGFKANPGEHTLLPNGNDDYAGVIFALGEESENWPRIMQLGALPRALPEGDYHLEGEAVDEAQALLFWLLGSYCFSHYKSESTPHKARLKVSKGTNTRQIIANAESIHFGRNLINTPAEDLGPQELEDAVRQLAKKHKAKVAATTGNALLTKNFPMIHAVGRASDRPPRLIDLTWGAKSKPKVTLVGKGICFDTGGLNIKPGNSMGLMKKDMGGAAATLALAHMIMSANLPVRLRVLIPAADNNVSANAFRPGDVLTSRNGMTVEISNTDAEGRLVLADALALADEEKPDYLFDFATLTGAARVALGPDIPPFYTQQDKLAEEIAAHGMEEGDPLWRMPFWFPYERMLKGSTGDINHCGDTPFAGSITAALFLKRFVLEATNYAHFDIYGWVPAAMPSRPQGGDPQAARAVFAYLSEVFQ